MKRSIIILIICVIELSFYGCENIDNDIIDSSEYQWIDKFYEGLAVVRNQDSLWGYINKIGKEVIRCNYKSAWSFSEGLARVMNKYDLWGYINKNGELVIPFKYKNAMGFKYGITKVTEDGENWYYIGKTGEKWNKTVLFTLLK